MQAHGLSGKPRTTERVAVWTGSAAAMLLPILPERLSGAVAWQASHFLFLIVLLVGVGTAYEIALRTPPRRAAFVATGFALAAGLVTMWINAAVGIVGSEDNPANLMFFAVIGVALGGACIALLHGSGMALAMLATACAQLTVFVIALVLGHGFTGPITVFFIALWLLSAALFRTAESQARRTTN